MTRLDPNRIEWLTDPTTRRVMTALADGGALDGVTGRFVGGAVRNALLGLAVDDIDIATPLPPDEVVRRMQRAGLKAVPTGIAYGTVTAVADGRPFEITSLRRDVASDGRHAVVEFGGSWAEDAQRRDFTMNALYASPDGEVFDPVGGVADLRAGRVRFIGDPDMRIREDYLRILRLFRFHAWYGAGEIDPPALASATRLAQGIHTLSGERIAKEMLKLLAAANPAEVLRQMLASGILKTIFAFAVDIDRLETLTALDRRYGFEADAVLRLAALKPDVGTLVERWHISKAVGQRLTQAVVGCIGSADLPHNAARRWIFRLGDQAFRDRVFLSWASMGGDNARWFALLELAELFEPPVFALSGRDVTATGLAGPAVGKTLEAVRTWWIEHDFQPSRHELIVQMQAIARSRQV